MSETVFKPGDLVKVVGPSRYGKTDAIGRVGVIDKSDRGKRAEWVLKDDGIDAPKRLNFWVFPSSSLELVEAGASGVNETPLTFDEAIAAAFESAKTQNDAPTLLGIAQMISARESQKHYQSLDEAARLSVA